MARRKSNKPSKPRKSKRASTAAANSNGAEPAAEAPIESQGRDGDLETLITKRELACALPGERWLELGIEAAGEAKARDDIKAKVKALNKQKQPHEDRLSEILKQFEQGGEMRMVDVRIEKDFAQNLIRAIRVDTDELVFDWRAMTADEREHQRVLHMDVVDQLAESRRAQADGAEAQPTAEAAAEADIDVEDGLPIEVQDESDDDSGALDYPDEEETRPNA